MKHAAWMVGAVLTAGGLAAADPCAFPLTTGADPNPGTVSYAGVDLDADGVRDAMTSDDLGAPGVSVSVSDAFSAGEATVDPGRLFCSAQRTPGEPGVTDVIAWAFVSDTRPIRLLARWDIGGLGAAVAVPPEGGAPIDGVLPAGGDTGTHAFTLDPGSYRLVTQATAVHPSGDRRSGWISLELVRACDVDADGDTDVDDIEAFVDAFLASGTIADCDGSGSVEIDDIECFVGCFLGSCP